VRATLNLADRLEQPLRGLIAALVGAIVGGILGVAVV
jgi:hypothetical protein